jgi:hypothetical protein
MEADGKRRRKENIRGWRRERLARSTSAASGGIMEPEIGKVNGGRRDLLGEMRGVGAD